MMVLFYVKKFEVVCDAAIGKPDAKYRLVKYLEGPH